MFRAIDDCPCPVIGCVQGAVYGGGVGLIAACDIAVAAANATFAFSEVRLGLVPAVIAPFVLAKVGDSFVRRFCLTGEPFSASTAQANGLIHDVVEPAALRPMSQHWLSRLPIPLRRPYGTRRRCFVDFTICPMRSAGRLVSKGTFGLAFHPKRRKGFVPFANVEHRTGLSRQAGSKGVAVERRTMRDSQRIKITCVYDPDRRGRSAGRAAK